MTLDEAWRLWECQTGHLAGCVAMDEEEQIRFWLEQHERKRQVLFVNEAFVIGMLQAVSGASVVGVLSQFDILLEVARRLPILMILTLLIIALTCAVVSALLKHQYIMWGVKARVNADTTERMDRLRKANRDLRWMRWLMISAGVLIVAAFAVFVVALWMQYMHPVYNFYDFRQLTPASGFDSHTSTHPLWIRPPV